MTVADFRQGMLKKNSFHIRGRRGFMRIYDNFDFVRTHDSKLHELLKKAENNAKIDVDASGGSLRKALEFFYTKLCDSREVEYEEYCTKKGLEPGSIERYKLYMREGFLIKNKIIEFDGGKGNQYFKAKTLRDSCHACAHILPPPGAPPLPEVTFDLLKNAFKSFHNVLISYYAILSPKKYNIDYTPIRGYRICEIMEIPAGSTCQKQFLGVNQDVTKKYAEYAIFREYAIARDPDNPRSRDRQTLDKVNRSSNNQNIINFSVHPPHNEEDYHQVYFVEYKTTFRPEKFNVNFINNLSFAERKKIAGHLFIAVRSMHMNNLYHRNICPESVIITRKDDGFAAELAYFEFTKMLDMGTVTNFKDHIEHIKKCSDVYLAPEVLDPEGTISNWEKPDIYSLGALIFFILTGEELCDEFDKRVKQVKEHAWPNELKVIPNTIARMLSMNVEDRPSIKEAPEVDFLDDFLSELGVPIRL